MKKNINAYKIWQQGITVPSALNITTKEIAEYSNLIINILLKK